MNSLLIMKQAVIIEDAEGDEAEKIDVQKNIQKKLTTPKQRVSYIV